MCHIARIPAADVLIEGLSKDEHLPRICVTLAVFQPLMSPLKALAWGNIVP